MKNLNVKFILLILCSCFIYSCSDSDEGEISDDTSLVPGYKGSGSFEFVDYAPLASQPVNVFFHIPANSNSNSPIVLVFHGDDRNASQYRDALINKSEQKKFIILAPEFSETYYPTGDKYNLGNVFVDGDNPTPSTLKPENTWTFSIIDPIFDYFKKQMFFNTSTYDIIGHSAGGQFAHRMVMFKPNAKYSKIVASASGWYTVPDMKVDFPYGFVKSPLENLPLGQLFSKKMYIQIGLEDNDPNSPGLRHNPQADAQGLNRLDRAKYFYNYSKNVAAKSNMNFQWELSTVAGLDHNFIPALNYAADLIYK